MMRDTASVSHPVAPGATNPPAIVREFAAGVDGVRPVRSVVDKAGRLVQAAMQGTMEPEIAVDVDGALSFDLRLSNGLLLLAELSIAGNLDASVYDDAAGERVQRLPQATAAQFMELLRSEWNRREQQLLRLFG